MIPSQRANLPQWSGRGFEIWFFVVLVPGVERALWVRMTRFADEEGSDARVWAVVSEDGGVTMQRELSPLDAMVLRDDGGPPDEQVFSLRVGEAELGHGFARGRCGRISWDLRFEARDELVVRLPKVPRVVPTGTHAVHPHSEAPVTGWVELDGRRLALDGGLFTQMHLWGSQRVEWLRWAWTPRFAGGGALELTAVAPKAGGPNLCALWAEVDGEVFDNSGLGKAVRAQLSTIRPGVLHHVGAASGRRLVVRVWAPAATFAGWDYRQIAGADLHVAQTNLARLELEIYRSARIGWIPQKRLRSTCAALEFHGLERYEELSYVPWDAVEVEAPARREIAAEPAPEPAPGEGRWVDTPAPSRIIGLGLTYADNAAQLARKPEPLVFELDAGAWSSGGGELRRPSSSRLRAVLDELDPSLGPALADYGFLPAMLDYEVELGLLLLDGLDDPAELDALAQGDRVALVVANDATARIVQILGEGQPDRMAYWRAAKSLPGLVPTSARAWVPARLQLDAWPALELEARVNGELRQRAAVDTLTETPRQLLARVREACGPLPPRTLILTGTPAGPALSVPRWKRAMGEHLLDRLGRLRVSIADFSAGTDFLRPGDLVRVSAGFLGALEHVVVAEPEPEPEPE